MKTLLSIFGILTIGFSLAMNPPADSNLDTQQLTFDGYEGGYYFFSDENHQAVILEADEALNVNLKKGNLEGKTFEVAYNAISKTPTSSSEGIIASVEKIK